MVDRRAASAICPSRTPTQVSSGELPPPRPVAVFCYDITVGLRFPGCLGDTQFSFRLRQSVGRRAARRQEEAYNRDAPITLQVSTKPLLPVSWFGFVKCGVVWCVERPLQTLADLTWLVSPDGGVPFLWLRLLQTGEGCVCEERILPEGQLAQQHLGVSPMMSCDRVM